ncbi:hypothetical protein Q7P36_007661 [Cladosporium allicinum]
MVLFDEDPVVLISETTNQFHITPDKDSLTRITTSLSALNSARTSRLTTQQTALKALSRRLNNLHSQHEYEENRHDAGKHASEILALDAEKFRVAKSAYDVEVEGERLEGELSGLKAVLEGLEREGVEGGEEGERGGGGMSLKLQVYRSLGIDVSQDANTGVFNRAVIRNPAKGDVNVVKVDGKVDKTVYANMFWDSL